MNNRKEDMEIASHYRQLLQELNEQRQHGILCDVCIIVEGKIFKAHKNVLLGSSRYFKTLYCQVQKTTEPATITHLDIVTAAGFKAIIDFMYSAHLALTSKNVIEVMSAASYLQMTDIVQACHNFIKAALEISIKNETSDELVEYELGTTSSGGADALISAVAAGRSISPWLARRPSPANSSGDSAIASCHEGGSSYGKEDQEPKADSHDDVSSQSMWSSDLGYGPLRIKEEEISAFHFNGNELHSAKDHVEGMFSEQGSGEGWQPSGRRKNRKNKETVRHITQQVDGDSRAGSPVPPFIWSFSGPDESEQLRPSASAQGRLHLIMCDADVVHQPPNLEEGAQKKSLRSDWNQPEHVVHDENSENPLLSTRTIVTQRISDDNNKVAPSRLCGNDDVTVIEPSNSDSREDRSDLYARAEEVLLGGESGYLTQTLGLEKGDGRPQAMSAANLRAALMSKNSLLSLKAEMLADDSSMLFEYLPKGTHSLSRPCTNLNRHPFNELDSNLEASTPPLPSSRLSSQSPPGTPHSGAVSPETVTQLSVDPLTQARFKRLSLFSPLETAEKDGKAILRTEEAELNAEALHLDSSQISTLTCVFCHSVFDGIEPLQQHINEHARSMLLPYDALAISQPLLHDASGHLPHGQLSRFHCSKCQASFTLKSNMDRHEKTIHFNGKKMRCPQCLKLFRDKTDLNRHLSSLHSCERLFKCIFCCKGFRTQKNLTTHMKACDLASSQPTEEVLTGCDDHSVEVEID